MHHSQKTSSSRLQPVTLSVADAGALLGISKTAMYRLLFKGLIPRLKIGKRTVIAVTDLERFVDAARKSAAETHRSMQLKG